MNGSQTPSPRIAVGCAELPPGMSRAAYFHKLSLLEMKLPGDAAPAARVAQRWAADAGERGQLSLVAPRWMAECHKAGARPAAEVDAAIAGLAEAANRARAAAVVFATPADLSPSSSHRDALRRFFAEVATAERFPGIARVWQPDGLWRPMVASAFAAEIGVTAVIDPLAPDPLEDGLPDAPEDIAYARVTGLGRPGRPLGTDDLAELLEWAGAAERAFVVFATTARFKDARTLARALE
jgi:uncharacterized protein YecE (DUF72 family)